MKRFFFICSHLLFAILMSCKSDCDIQRPYRYQEILQYQETCIPESFPKVHYLDLNGDGIDEEFQAVRAYSRGLDYAIFRKTPSGSWEILPVDIDVPSGTLGLRLLPDIREGYHDFVSIQAHLGSNDTMDFLFQWDGSRYVLK